MALGKLVVNLSANISEFGSSMDKAAHVADRNMTAISRSVGIMAVAVGVAAVKAATGFAAMASQAIQAADDIDKAATKAGIAVESMQGLAYAAAMADIDINGLSDSLKKMQVNIAKAANGSKEQVETFKALNIPIKELASLAPEDQFLAIGEQISKIKDPGQRALALIEAFGKSGTGLAPVFEDGAAGVQKMIEEAKKLGLVLSKEQNDKLVEADDNIKRLGQSWDGFVKQAVASASGPLSFVFETLQKVLTPQDLAAQIKTAEIQLQSLEKGFRGEGSDYDRISKTLARLKKEQAEEIRIAEETKKKLAEITVGKTPGGFENEEDKAAREKAAREAAAATKRIEGERKAILDSSLETYMRLVLSAEEMAMWELASKGANAEQLATLHAQLEATIALTKQKEAQKEADEKTKDLDKEKAALIASFPDLWYNAATAVEKYALDLAKAEELGRKLVAAGLDQARATEYVARVQKNLSDEYSKATDIAVEFGDAISSSLEEAILAGRGLQDVMKGLLQDILAIIIRVKVTEPLGDAITKWLKGSGGAGGGAGGGSGFWDTLLNFGASVVTSAFGGGATVPTGINAVPVKGVTAPLPSTFSPPGRALGGSVMAGNAFTVGEAGRELFVPANDGVIFSNGATERLLGGGDRGSRVVNQTFNITTPNADSFRLSQRQLSRRARVGINV